MEQKKTDAEMVDEFIVTKVDFETKTTLEAANAILDCELKKKLIAEEIKDIKTEAKVNGVQVQQITKAIKAIKTNMKRSDIEKRDDETMYDLLLENADIRFKIENLNSD
jgi:uncharacterized protein (UPF0335 family)